MYDFEFWILCVLVAVVLGVLPVAATWLAPAYSGQRRPLIRLIGYAAAAFCVLAVSGVAHGLRTDRWFVADGVIAAAERLQSVPTEFGDWTSESVKTDAEMLRIAEARGCYSRRFVNNATGELVHALILCGRPGPIAVHTPDVCFVAAGQELVIQQSHVAKTPPGGALGEFYVGDFRRTVEGVPYQMRTFWAWSADGRWKISENTRLEFATYPYLYKLYVSHAVPLRSDFDEHDAALQFMHEFLPLANAALFPKPQE